MFGNATGIACIILVLYAPVWLPSVLVIVLVVMEFLSYRHFISHPPLSTSALRGRLLTPDWQKYSRRAFVLFCSLLLYHGLCALLVQYVSDVLAFAWLLGTMLTPFLPICIKMALIGSIRFVPFLPDSVFENGAIDHEAIRRIRKENRRKQKEVELERRSAEF